VEIITCLIIFVNVKFWADVKLGPTDPTLALPYGGGNKLTSPYPLLKGEGENSNHSIYGERSRTTTLGINRSYAILPVAEAMP